MQPLDRVWGIDPGIPCIFSSTGRGQIDLLEYPDVDGRQPRDILSNPRNIDSPYTLYVLTIRTSSLAGAAFSGERISNTRMPPFCAGSGTKGDRDPHPVSAGMARSQIRAVSVHFLRGITSILRTLTATKCQRLRANCSYVLNRWSSGAAAGPEGQGNQGPRPWQSAATTLSFRIMPLLILGFCQ
jgi:hypothetical protein